MIDRILKIAEVFSALGDKRRLLIIRLLSSNPDYDFRLEDIIEFLKISEIELSHHIRILQDAGFVKMDREENGTFYYVNPEFLRVWKREIDTTFDMFFNEYPHLDKKTEHKDQHC